MTTIDLDKQTGTLTLQPSGPLAAKDFKQVAEVVDPFIASEGVLNGVVIDAAKFSGWDGFGAALDHFRFIRDHHKHVRKVAVVTDSAAGKIAEHLLAHFIAAKVELFPSGRLADAKAWATEA